jgi:hypothetical protein
MATKTMARTTRTVLGALTTLSLIAGLATPAAAGGLAGGIGGGESRTGAGWGSVGGGDFRTAALPARSGEEIPTNLPSGADRPIVIPR